MKLRILIALLLLGACSNNEPTPSQNQNQTPAVLVPDDSLPDQAVVLAKGTFTDGAIGSVEAFDDGIGNKGLQFKKNFLVSGCTDLKVYLSPDLTLTNAISVGALKATKGAQTYSLAGTPDFAKFKNVILWCQTDSASHGVAELK